MIELEILKETRRLLEEEGWIQKSYHKSGEGYCLEGAWRSACRQTGASLEQSVNSYQYLDDKIFRDSHTFMTRWNDELGRTKEEVLAVVVEAISLIER